MIAFFASQPSAFLAIGRDARHALFGEGLYRADQYIDFLKQAVGDDRHHDVQLELSGLRRQRDRRVVAEYVEHRHIEHLGQHRVDLAGHDRGAGLHGGQADFVQPGRWAAAQQAQIVRDADQILRQRPDRARERTRRPAYCSSNSNRLSLFVERHIQIAAQRFDHPRMVFGMRVQTGAGRRAADRQPLRPSAPRSIFSASRRDGLRIAAKFLTEPHRDGILQVGASALDDRSNSFALTSSASASSFSVASSPIQPPQRPDADRGRDRVVGALRHIHMIVGADGLCLLRRPSA